jgi:hypothetical protein
MQERAGTTRYPFAYFKLRVTNLGDIFGQVFAAIWANKLRSFLTMFGIAWGVGSLLLLVGLGEGFRSGQRRQMATLGNDVIFMSGGNIPAVPSQHTGMRPYQLTLRDAVTMRTESASIRDATAILENDAVKQVSAYASSGGTVNGAEPNRARQISRRRRPRRTPARRRPRHQGRDASLSRSCRYWFHHAAQWFSL